MWINEKYEYTGMGFAEFEVNHRGRLEHEVLDTVI
jgi:hypothetical protein